MTKQFIQTQHNTTQHTTHTHTHTYLYIYIYIRVCVCLLCVVLCCVGLTECIILSYRTTQRDGFSQNLLIGFHSWYGMFTALYELNIQITLVPQMLLIIITLIKLLSESKSGQKFKILLFLISGSIVGASTFTLVFICRLLRYLPNFLIWSLEYVIWMKLVIYRSLDIIGQT
jgi:hypothetical protein